MPDSEELDEILKEIKNINAPKEKPEPKEEQPLTLADDKPAKEEAKATPKPVKENVLIQMVEKFLREKAW